MRHDDQPVDLLVGIVGERKHRPVIAAFACAHLDAAHDAVGTGSGRDLDAVAFGLLQLGSGGKVDRLDVDPDVDGFSRARRVPGQQRGQGKRKRRRAADDFQSEPPAKGSGQLVERRRLIKFCKQDLTRH